MVVLVLFHITLRMYIHIFITICESIILLHTSCQGSALLSLLYLKYFLFYFVLLPIQQPEKEKYITMLIIFTYFKVQKWGGTVPLHFLSKQQQLE